MKLLAITTLMAVPRPFVVFLGDQFMALANFMWKHPVLMLSLATAFFASVCGSLEIAWHWGGNW